MKKVLTLLGMMWALALSPTAFGQPVVKYHHTDALGSVAVVTDENRNVVERREYEPYGAQLTPAVQGGPGYTGHVQDAATGLVYMQQRYYDPQLGVFLSVDPVTAYELPISQFHRYRYANNNPYLFIDPDGRQSFRMGPVNPQAARAQAIAQARTSEARAYAGGKVVDAVPKSALGEVGGSVSGGTLLSGAAQGSAGVIAPLTGDAAGGYATGGAMISLAGDAVSAPSGDPGQSQFSLGGAVEAGVSIGVTNATSSAQLEGAATAYSLNTPAFRATVTTSEGGTWTATVGSGAAGLSVTKQQVETVDLSRKNP